MYYLDSSSDEDSFETSMSARNRTFSICDEQGLRSVPIKKSAYNADQFDSAEFSKCSTQYSLRIWAN